MTELAYSKEERKNITAKTAHKKSLNKELKYATNFECSDQSCRVPLTCTNWGEKKGKRIYFRLSSNSNPHDVGCEQATYKEKITFVKDEHSRFKDSIEKIEAIKMVKANSNNHNPNLMSKQNKYSTNNQSGNKNIFKKKNKIKKESYTSKILATFIELFTDETVDKNKKLILIDNERISLSELFIPIEDVYKSFDKTRIYFGKAKIKTANFNQDIAEIEFIDSNKRLKKIYSNLASLKKGAFTKFVSQVIDKEEPVTVYFRGQVMKDFQSMLKLESFNEKVYQDLCIYE